MPALEQSVLHRATGSILEQYGISIADAKAGTVEADHLQ
jgi:hypothetical protein